jgi:hypothetical protein
VVTDERLAAGSLTTRQLLDPPTMMPDGSPLLSWADYVERWANIDRTDQALDFLAAHYAVRHSIAPHFNCFGPDVIRPQSNVARGLEYSRLHPGQNVVEVIASPVEPNGGFILMHHVWDLIEMSHLACGTINRNSYNMYWRDVALMSAVLKSDHAHSALYLAMPGGTWSKRRTYRLELKP